MTLTPLDSSLDSMSDISPKIIPKSIEIQAYTFGRLALDLYQAHLTIWPTNDAEATQFARFGIPFVVNGAFAIELYFKTLYMIHSGSLPRGHNLSKLFDGLPIGTRTAVNNAASDKSSTSEVSWIGYVKEVSEAFVQIRYLFEQKQNMKLPIPEIVYLLEVLSAATTNELERLKP